VKRHVTVRPVLIARCASIADQTQGQALRVALQAALRQVLGEVGDGTADPPASRCVEPVFDQQRTVQADL
jgi:hypothetical protein